MFASDERRIDVDRAEELVQAQPVTHRENELDDEVARVLADDRRAEDLVLARHGQHLDEAVRFFVGDRAVEIVEPVGRHLVGDVFLFRFGFVQADARDFGLGERRPRNDRVIGPELLKRPKSAFTAAYHA